MAFRTAPLPQPRAGNTTLIAWLDVLAVIAWGIMLLKYWFTGKLNLLLHPDYMWLANSAGVFLTVLGVLKASQLLQTMGRRSPRSRRLSLTNFQHFTLFPPGWSSALLLGVAIFGLLFTPKPFASDTALSRGVTETLTMTRSQPQAFRSSARSEDRSLIEWVRTLNVYPEPDAYAGQKAKVQGFVIHSPTLPDNYLLISRFVITCCAADAYPIGLPVQLTESRTKYAPDTWLEIEGQMITETLDDRRQLAIQATSLKEIEEPKNPYDY